MIFVEFCFDIIGYMNWWDEVDRIGVGLVGVLGSVFFLGVIGNDGFGGRVYIVGVRFWEWGWGILVDGFEFG